MVGIYRIINPKGKIYIGQAIDLDKRLYQYQKPKKNQIGIQIYNSLMKYGVNTHIIQIIEECKLNVLNEREIYWIKHYNCIKEGLNIELGGKGGKRSEETKEKIRIGSMGKNSRKITQYNLKNQSVKTWNSIRLAEDVYGKGIKSVLCGKIHTAGGFIWRYEEDLLPSSYKTPAHPNRKPLIQYDLEGNFIKEWGSTIEVQKTLGYSNSNISMNAIGKSKTAYGYKWKYKNDI
jgi:group I intron endonuclease